MSVAVPSGIGAGARHRVNVAILRDRDRSPASGEAAVLCGIDAATWFGRASRSPRGVEAGTWFGQVSRFFGIEAGARYQVSAKVSCGIEVGTWFGQASRSFTGSRQEPGFGRAPRTFGSEAGARRPANVAVLRDRGGNRESGEAFDSAGARAMERVGASLGVRTSRMSKEPGSNGSVRR